MSNIELSATFKSLVLEKPFNSFVGLSILELIFEIYTWMIS